MTLYWQSTWEEDFLRKALLQQQLGHFIRMSLLSSAVWFHNEFGAGTLVGHI